VPVTPIEMGAALALIYSHRSLWRYCQRCHTWEALQFVSAGACWVSQGNRCTFLATDPGGAHVDAATIAAGNPVVVRYLQAGHDAGSVQSDHDSARDTGRERPGTTRSRNPGQPEGDTTDDYSGSDDMMLPQAITVAGLSTRAGGERPASVPIGAEAWMNRMVRQWGAGRGEGSSRATGSNDPMVPPMNDRDDGLTRAQAEFYKIRKAVTAVLRYDFKCKFTTMEDLARTLRMRCSAERLEIFFRHECPHMGEHRFILFEEDGERLVRAIPSIQRHPRTMGKGRDP